MIYLVSLISLLHLRVVHVVKTVLTWHLEVSKGRWSLIVSTTVLTTTILSYTFIGRNLRIILAVIYHLVIFLYVSIICQFTHMVSPLAWGWLRYLRQFLRALPIYVFQLTWLTLTYVTPVLLIHSLLWRMIAVLLHQSLLEISQIVGSFLLKVLLLFPYSNLRLRTIAAFGL